ncbi:MAG TPA: SdrD B-like domain-containing protein, partial [Gemmataceae bacterium]|nr:SdrD B-like domain-containing protein [Gemmataceae bacterium]
MSRSDRARRRPLRVENLEGRDVPAVTGMVFNDADHDGVRETGDVGIGGVVIELFKGGEFAERVTTETDGTFSFATIELDTPYQLRIETPQPPIADLTLSPANEGTDETLDSDATAEGAFAVVSFTSTTPNGVFDFGFGTAAAGGGLTLGGTVFPDPDDTGTFTSGGIAGVNVQLLPADNDTPIASTPTDSAGNYSFTDLEPGTYRVRIAPANFAPDQPLDGFTPSTSSTADADDDVDDDSNGTVSGTLGSGGFVVTGPITLAAGEEPDGDTNLTVDFGMVDGTPAPTGASITGQVFLDYDNTGVFDGPDVSGPDTGLSGVTVRLTGGALTAPVTVTTDSSGVFTFAGLQPGTYTLTQVQPTAPDNSSGQDVPGSAGGDNSVANVISDIVLAEDEEATDYFFAEIPKVGTGGTVFQDTNGNGQLDTGEPGIPNVTVTLTGTSVVTGEEINPVTVTTNASGMYSFTNLDPGTYTITQTQPSGFTDGEEQNGTPEATVGDDEFADIDLTSVATSGGFNFAETTGSTGGTGAIGGFVYTDTDNDGAKDTGETGIVGVTITLTGTDDQSQPVSRTTTTEADGSFTFANLRAGTYTLTEAQPAGATDGQETAGTAGGSVATNDAISGIVLAAGDIATGYLFGETTTATGGTASIAGTVFADADNDGVKDTGENGIQGVTVTLTGTDDQSQPVSRTATTGADGTYSFTGLRAGTYALAQTQPTGFTDGTDTAGTAGGTLTAPDSITGITLDAAEAATGYLFADVATSTGGTGSIAGTVFADADNDGVRDTGENGIPNVIITLTGTDDQSQAVNLTATTGTDGTFSFANLRAGTYALAQTQPANFT